MNVKNMITGYSNNFFSPLSNNFATKANHREKQLHSSKIIDQDIFTPFQGVKIAASLISHSVKSICFIPFQKGDKYQLLKNNLDSLFQSAEVIYVTALNIFAPTAASQFLKNKKVSLEGYFLIYTAALNISRPELASQILKNEKITFQGDFHINSSNLKYFSSLSSKEIEINGSLFFEQNVLEDHNASYSCVFPKKLTVKENVVFNGPYDLSHLPETFNIGKNLTFKAVTGPIELPKHLEVGGDFTVISCPSFKKFSGNEKIKGNIGICLCKNFEGLPAKFKSNKNISITASKKLKSLS